MRMNRYKSLFSYCILVAIVASACSKGGDSSGLYPDPNDSTTPVVVINHPVNNQVFNSGDIINIDGKVTDNSLYQGSIRIIDDASGTIMKEQQYEIHGFQGYAFTLAYQANVTEVSNYTVTVQYEDHALNIGTQSVKIKINP